jgi:hypothetical protein
MTRRLATRQRRRITAVVYSSPAHRRILKLFEAFGCSFAPFLSAYSEKRDKHHYGKIFQISLK